MSLELTLDEQELQDLMDKMTNEIFSQLGISNTTMQKDNSAVKASIYAYDAYMQKKSKEEK